MQRLKELAILIPLYQFLKQRTYPTREGIAQHLEKKAEQEDRSESLSEATFHRYKRKLREYLGIEVTYCKQNKGYFIEHESDLSKTWINALEHYKLWHLMDLPKEADRYLWTETNPSNGQNDLLLELIQAILGRHPIEFRYQKYWEAEARPRRARPYLLREYQRRWYLLVQEEPSLKFKTFGLDRLKNLKVREDQRFELLANFNPRDFFANHYGIITDVQTPEEIILHFRPFQGRYIKTLPLHQSQEILRDDPKEGLTVRLLMCNTLDFRMFLLSQGAECRVLHPPSLVAQMRQSLAEALARYGD